MISLLQNIFPQGSACRDIALNTQYLVLFNNPIDRQQVATLARRIYPSKHSVSMKAFEAATFKPYGHLVVDLKSDTSEKYRLRANIFDRQNGSGITNNDSDRSTIQTTERHENQRQTENPTKRQKVATPELDDKEDDSYFRYTDDDDDEVIIRKHPPPGYPLEALDSLHHHSSCSANHMN